MVAPKDESSDLVMQWIESEGLGKYATISERQDSVVIEASISKIEKLLKAEYAPFGKLLRLTYMMNITNSNIQKPIRQQAMS